MSVSARFAAGTRFADHYKRNNKTKGRKNLRCFPDCRLAGHVKTGYCGRPVECDVTYDAVAANDLNIMAFCEFLDDGKPGTTVGRTFQFSEIVTNSRGTGHNPGDSALHPWFPGAVIASSIDSQKGLVNTQFAFNKAKQGWHYAWQSHGPRGHGSGRSTKHTLHIFILAGHKTSSLFTCVCELSSPTFEVHCRRKRTSPSKAASCLLNFTANPTLVGTKRSAADISSAPVQHQFVHPNMELDGARRCTPPSPNRQINERASEVGHIMPSNSVAKSPKQSPVQGMRHLQAKSAEPLSAARYEPEPGSNDDLFKRIQELEAKKKELERQMMMNAAAAKSSKQVAPASALALLSAVVGHGKHA